MSINDPNLVLFRISTTNLGKIKERKYSPNPKYFNKKFNYLKCSICWETSNIDSVTQLCMTCNNPIIKKENYNEFEVENEKIIENKETKQKKNIQKKNKTYFNNYFYNNNSEIKNNNIQKITANEKDNCDSNCKCIIM